MFGPWSLSTRRCRISVTGFAFNFLMFFDFFLYMLQVERVSHRDNIQSFVQKSENLEKQCLAKAIKSYCELRVLPNEENRTVVFWGEDKGEKAVDSDYNLYVCQVIHLNFLIKILTTRRNDDYVYFKLKSHLVKFKPSLSIWLAEIIRQDWIFFCPPKVSLSLVYHQVSMWIELLNRYFIFVFCCFWGCLSLLLYILPPSIVKSLFPDKKKTLVCSFTVYAS